MSSPTFSIRIAKLTDSDALSAVFSASYSSLLSACYDSDLLIQALPHFTKANPTLLACGTYYVAATEPGDLVGCGGWTPEKPGTGEIIEGEAHIRHFATHPHWTRHGIGSALLGRCISDARSIGITKLHCLSTLNAEHFYRASGFNTLGPIDVQVGSSLIFPAVLMICQIA